MRVKIVFAGWRDAKTGNAVGVEHEGRKYGAHEGDKIKALLGIKRLTPVYTRA